MGTVLTVAEIAQQLHLPESTVRYYRDRFSAYIPVVGEGRHRRYPEEAVEVFRTIADGLRGGGSAGLVEDTLARTFARTTTLAESRTQSPAVASPVDLAIAQSLMQTQNLLGNLQAALSALAQAQSDGQQSISDLSQEVACLRAQLEHRQRFAEARDRQIVADIRAALTPRRSWWRRVLSSSPAHHSAPSA
ncbi:MAG: MerR family transcriptional regulator [Thermaerobacter sp.]|nr:MerR family transcriptional regulator [Thermaerobacter sp.]